jgi:drug/metabolite transporter (DMT)-like permease
MSLAISENRRLRRIASGLLIVLGALLILLAPETWVGAVLLALGVAVELIGMVLAHQSRYRKLQ